MGNVGDISGPAREAAPALRRRMCGRPSDISLGDRARFPKFEALTASATWNERDGSGNRTTVAPWPQESAASSHWGSGEDRSEHMCLYPCLRENLGLSLPNAAIRPRIICPVTPYMGLGAATALIPNPAGADTPRDQRKPRVSCSAFLAVGRLEPAPSLPFDRERLI